MQFVEIPRKARFDQVQGIFNWKDAKQLKTLPGSLVGCLPACLAGWVYPKRMTMSIPSVRGARGGLCCAEEIAFIFVTC